MHTIPFIHIHSHTCTRLLHHGSSASVPGPVQNIRAVVDPKQASIKLNWDPPLDFKRPGKGTTYRIRFKPEGRSNYVEKAVTTNHVSLTRKSGLQASNMHKFEVRAENVEAPGEWKIYSAYVGRFILNFGLHDDVCI